jgi:uncharacterized membrane protein
MTATSTPDRARPERSTPTYPPPPARGMTPVLERNIRAMKERRENEERRATLEERIAQKITDFTGSMRFVYVHLAAYGFWILANLGWIPGVPAWDPTFVVLAMVASVEAIFLSTFVLISQNRISAAADKRADLDLQISLLAEHELTKLVELVTAMADHMGLNVSQDRELQEVQQDVAPEAVLDEIEEANGTKPA